MAIEIIDLGTVPLDGSDGDVARVAFEKVNANFAEHEAEIDALTPRVTSLENEVGQLEIQAGQIQGDLTNLTESFNILSSEVGGNTADIQNLENSREYTLVAGANINIDRSNPEAPVISSAGQQGGTWGTISGNISDQTDLQNALNGKVDKVEGKQLSSEDYTTEDKTLLQQINTRTSNLEVLVDDYIIEGFVDNSQAFQAAIDTGAWRVSCSGRRAFNIATTVNLRSNLLLDLGGSQVTVTSSGVITTPFYGLDVQNVKVINGTIICQGKALSGIRIYSNTVGCRSIQFNRLIIKGTASDPTLQYGGIEVASLQGLQGAENFDVSITDCDFNSVGTHGALVYHTSGVTFNSNRIDTVQNHGMEAVACRSVVIDGNRVANCQISALGVGAGTNGFVISNNFAINCGGDGTYTVEHNSINGVVEGNIGLECNTTGINVSHGESGLISSDRIRNIAVRNNILRQKQGLTNHIGINVYGQDSLVGTSVTVTGNTVDGFSRPIEYAYLEDGCVIGNTIDNSSGITPDFAIKGTFIVRTKIEQNICSSDTADHAYQLRTYNSKICNGVSVTGNSTIASGGGNKALVYIEGAGTHQVGRNSTQGSSHFIESTSNPTVFSTGDVGPLTSSPYQGVIVLATFGGPTSSVVGTAGTASPLPSAPEAYMTIYSPTLGQVKIPVYKV